MFVTIYVSGKLGAKANRDRTVVVGAETLAKRVYITEVTTYDYTPVDPSDPVLPVDTRPRTVVRKLNNIECERTYYVYSPLTNIVERVGAQGAAYGGTNVLRTITTFYPAGGPTSVSAAENEGSAAPTGSDLITTVDCHSSGSL